MSNQVSESRASQELSMINNPEVRERFKKLKDDFKVIINKVKDGTIKPIEYAQAAHEFNELTIYGGKSDAILKFTLFVLEELEFDAINDKTRSIRKKKGSYSVPDKVIDGVIMNIVYGEKVEDACGYAGITPATLYNRIKDKGYTDIKEFFKMKRRELKGDN